MDIVYVLHSLAWNDGKNIKATQLLQLWMESYILIYFLSGHYICCLLFLLAGARACTHADIVFAWMMARISKQLNCYNIGWTLYTYLFSVWPLHLLLVILPTGVRGHTHTTLVGKIRNDNLAVKSFWRNSDIMLFHIQPRMQKKTRWSEMFW